MGELNGSFSLFVALVYGNMMREGGGKIEIERGRCGSTTTLVVMKDVRAIHRCVAHTGI